MPHILFPGKRLRDIGFSMFPAARYSATDHGWMDSETFLVFLEYFNGFLEEQEIKKPVVLFVDGHSSHSTFEAGKFCKENGIVLYCLLAHSSHILQPLDVGVFGPLKTAYRNASVEWQFANPNAIPTKHHFPGIFKNAWAEAASEGNAMKGFKHSGIFPFQPQVLSMSDRLLSSPSQLGQPSSRFASLTSTIDGTSSMSEVLDKTTPVVLYDSTTTTCGSASHSTAMTHGSAVTASHSSCHRHIALLSQRLIPLPRHMAQLSQHLIPLPRHMAQLSQRLILLPRHMAQLSQHLILLPRHMAQLSQHLILLPRHMAQLSQHLTLLSWHVALVSQRLIPAP